MAIKPVRFTANTQGRDFIVGDLHGCFEQFNRLLDEIGFNKNIDRMFSCGDLVDRGPNSLECAMLLKEPWFFAVLGNHEDMFLQNQADAIDFNVYRQNGGDWAMWLEDEQANEIYDLFNALPIVIELEAEQGLIGIVHANISGHYWNYALGGLQRMEAIWSRDRITFGHQHEIRDIHKIFHGHTIVKKPYQLGNCIYIDTGCFAGKKLTCYSVHEDVYFSIPYFKHAEETHAN